MAEGYHGGKSRKRNLLGLQLDRPTSTLPTVGYGALFTITGGRIILTSMVGEITTVIESQATTIKITATPSTGTAVDIATDLDCNAAVVNSLLGIGAYVGAMVGETGAVPLPVNSIVIPVGTLGITTGDTSTGAIQWSITYYPYDDNAVIVVA